MLYVVLNDGETYTDAEGCRLIDGPDDLDTFEDYLANPESFRAEYAGEGSLPTYRVRPIV